jgi:hypothetical protein
VVIRGPFIEQGPHYLQLRVVREKCKITGLLVSNQRVPRWRLTSQLFKRVAWRDLGVAWRDLSVELVGKAVGDILLINLLMKPWP